MPHFETKIYPSLSAERSQNSWFLPNLCCLVWETGKKEDYRISVSDFLTCLKHFLSLVFLGHLLVALRADFFFFSLLLPEQQSLSLIKYFCKKSRGKNEKYIWVKETCRHHRWTVRDCADLPVTPNSFWAAHEDGCRGSVFGCFPIRHVCLSYSRTGIQQVVLCTEMIYKTPKHGIFAIPACGMCHGPEWRKPKPKTKFFFITECGLILLLCSHWSNQLDLGVKPAWIWFEPLLWKTPSFSIAGSISCQLHQTEVIWGWTLTWIQTESHMVQLPNNFPENSFC